MSVSEIYVMPIAGAMSHIIPNHILRVGQSTCLDSAHKVALGCSPSAMMDPNGSCSEQDDLDVSLDNLNQLILELDPTFEPIHFNKRSQSSSLHTGRTMSERGHVKPNSYSYAVI